MLKDIIKSHIKRYEFHEPQDIYKLIYQGEFAGGHIIENKEKHLAYLMKELTLVEDCEYKAPEQISDDYARVHLDGLTKTYLTVDTLEKMVLNSAANNTGNYQRFEDKLTVWKTLEKVEVFVAKMKELNYPLVHHSDTFRNTYHPAYRIIELNYAFYMKLFMAIDKLLKDKKQVVIAVDGDAGSGKSVLGNLLQSIYETDIIRMDDFFLTNDQRTPNRLSEVGGNIDYERFYETVIKPLKEKKEITYQPYNCQTNLFEEEIVINTKQLIIVEGSYSLRKEFVDAYDLKVVLHVDSKIQVERIRARNERLLNRFIGEWIPKEKAYAKSYKIDKVADFIFNTSKTTIQ